ncbi:MAG TPA: hypothetical protein ENK57_15970, partial [Polyangiaceae bacterium]|nr:hypothetical protein [Polyangiaceae bacterium]
MTQFASVIMTGGDAHLLAPTCDWGTAYGKSAIPLAVAHLHKKCRYFRENGELFPTPPAALNFQQARARVALGVDEDTGRPCAWVVELHELPRFATVVVALSLVNISKIEATDTLVMNGMEVNTPIDAVNGATLYESLARPGLWANRGTSVPMPTALLRAAVLQHPASRRWLDGADDRMILFVCRVDTLRPSCPPSHVQVLHGNSLLPMTLATLDARGRAHQRALSPGQLHRIAKFIAWQCQMMGADPPVIVESCYPWEQAHALAAFLRTTLRRKGCTCIKREWVALATWLDTLATTRGFWQTDDTAPRDTAALRPVLEIAYLRACARTKDLFERQRATSVVRTNAPSTRDGWRRSPLYEDERAFLPSDTVIAFERPVTVSCGRIRQSGEMVWSATGTLELAEMQSRAERLHQQCVVVQSITRPDIVFKAAFVIDGGVAADARFTLVVMSYPPLLANLRSIAGRAHNVRISAMAPERVGEPTDEIMWGALALGQNRHSLADLQLARMASLYGWDDFPTRSGAHPDDQREADVVSDTARTHYVGRTAGVIRAAFPTDPVSRVVTPIDIRTTTGQYEAVGSILRVMRVAESERDLKAPDKQCLLTIVVPGLDAAYSLRPYLDDEVMYCTTDHERTFLSATGRPLPLPDTPPQERYALQLAAVVVVTVDRYAALAERFPGTWLLTSRMIVMMGLSRLPISDVVHRLVMEVNVKRVVSVDTYDGEKEVTKTPFTSAEYELLRQLPGPLRALHESKT